MKTGVQPDILITVLEQTDVARARRLALQAAQKAEFGENESGALALVVTEAATNLVKHGGGGDLIVREISNSRPLLEIIAIDSGKGMPDVSRCFADGYSTAGSAGIGLGAIARLSQAHDIFSSADKGTVLMAQVGPGTTETDDRLDIGAISIPYPGEDVCGDAWGLDVSPERIRLIVADGLGHGVFASEASTAAMSAVNDRRNLQPADVLEAAHLLLKATRGAAAGVVDVDSSATEATFASVGNVAGATVSEAGVRRQMISLNGTLGHQMSGARQYPYPLERNSLIVVHSDGVGAHWSLEKYPGLAQRHPSVIAGVLFRDFRRTRDDATVVVIRPHSVQS